MNTTNGLNQLCQGERTCVRVCHVMRCAFGHSPLLAGCAKWGQQARRCPPLKNAACYSHRVSTQQLLTCNAVPTIHTDSQEGSASHTRRLGWRRLERMARRAIRVPRVLPPNRMGGKGSHQIYQVASGSCKAIPSKSLFPSPAQSVRSASTRAVKV